jgi:hypothetical protein
MVILQTVIGALVTFVFVTLLGNWVLQNWQQRSWLNQQRFLGKQTEYNALKDLFEEIVSLAGRRITRMRRLQRVLRGGDDELVKARLEEYDKIQTEWNDRLNSFYVRLRFYAADYEMADRLEKQIQDKFVSIGSRLEQAVKHRQEGTRPASHVVTGLDNNLNDLYRAIIVYTRDMLRHIEEIKKETYFGVEVKLKPDTLELFPTWQLFIALFKPRIQTHSIIRTAIDLGEPKRSCG